jgi:uncharacterized SAM-binding protein YcdF (DUF218 family)
MDRTSRAVASKPGGQRRRLAWVGVIGAAMLTGVVLGGGRFLLREDTVDASDLAVVLSGEPPSRALAARDLYRKGLVRRVLIVPEGTRWTELQQELLPLGLFGPKRPPLSERILIASGVPRSAIMFLPEPVDGTVMEARRVRAFLANKDVGRLVIITSKFASRRACFIFRRVLSPAQVLCSPTPYDTFEPATWWRDSRSVSHVTTEYLKLVVNAFALLAPWSSPAASPTTATNGTGRDGR